MGDYEKLSKEDKELVNRFVRFFDKQMRGEYVCNICGKPLVGVVEPGQSREDAGLCLCNTD